MQYIVPQIAIAIGFLLQSLSRQGIGAGASAGCWWRALSWQWIEVCFLLLRSSPRQCQVICKPEPPSDTEKSVSIIKVLESRKSARV